MRHGCRASLLLALGALVLGAGPARAADPVVAAAGDIACGPAETGVFPCQQRATSDLLISIHPDRVLALGDNQYNSGALPDYNNFYDPTWGRLKAITNAAIGNHDYGGNGGGAGFWDYYGGAGGPRGDGWYSFDLGAWHIVALNSNCDIVSCAAGSAQEQWLRQDLATHPAACTLAFAHQPLWSSPAFQTPAVRPLFQALYDADAEIYLVGHAHIYNRFAPSAPDQRIDGARGIQQFIVGTGGRDLSGLAAQEPNSQVRNNTTFGVMKLTLHPSSYDWQFVPIGGQSFSDSGSRACHGAGAPPRPVQPTAPTQPAPPNSATPPLAPRAPAASPGEEDEQEPVITRLRVASADFERSQLLVRGRITTGASARLLRLTLARGTRRGTIRIRHGARGGRTGSWSATIPLRGSARGLRRFSLTVRYLGQRGYTAKTLRTTLRAR